MVNMPIYEYRCESCGDKFEKLVRRSDDALEAGCPACGEKKLRQEYSTFAARATSAPSGASAAMPEMSGCPGGMCGNPGMCGRN
jgi:putative FmdB family regulatory protein